MPQIFREKDEEIKKKDFIKADIKVDSIRSFSTVELSESLKKLDIIYDIDDRIGFVIRLLRSGIKDKSYHVAIISELTKLLKELDKLSGDPNINIDLYNRVIDTIKRVIKTNTWPVGYEELIKLLSEFRVKMFLIEERSLSILNEQFNRLISEYPDLYPDIPIEYSSQDEEIVRNISLSEFSSIITLSYKIIKAIEMEKYKEAKENIEKFRQLLDELFVDPPNQDPKNIIGYAKYILSLFYKASNDQLKRGIDVIKISIVFQLGIRLFIIRFKIDYPGDSERVKSRMEFYKG